MKTVVLQQLLACLLVLSSNLALSLRSMGEPKVGADLGPHRILNSGTSITASCFNLLRYINIDI